MVGPKKAKLICDLPLPKMPEVPGTVLVCGQGDVGQLGLGEDEVEKKRPTVLTSVKDVVDICAGGMHSLCLTKSGEIFSFGCNDEGALGRDSSADGAESTPEKIALPGKCIKISAGDSHSACILSDGRAFAWGSFRDSHGNMGLTLEGNKRKPTEVLPGIKCSNIASGGDHLVILTCDGQVYTMGCAEQGQLGRISIRSASGESRRGKTELLQPGKVIIKNVKHVDAIWASVYCTYVRKLGSTEIYAFGLNNHHQLALKNKSKSSQNNETVTKPVLASFNNVKKISGGQHHTLLLTKDNKVYTIGRCEYGRLGLGKDFKEDIDELKQIKSLDKKDITDISCGEYQSFAISKDGIVYSWGLGSNLQLGTGKEEDEWEPVAVVSKSLQDQQVFKLCSGGQHSVFLIRNPNNNYKSLSTKTVVAKPEQKPDVAKIESKEKTENIEDDKKLNGDIEMEVSSETSNANKKSRKRK